MKSLLKKTYIIGFILFLTTAGVLSQELVSTEPQLRNVVLEEFTGIHCGNCPGGHKKAKELAESNPGRVVLIAIHEGSYANPGVGEPDFRTQWGASILAQTKLSGFPAGTINRLRFPGSDYSFPYNTQMTGGMALGPNGWDTASNDSILNGEFSPVNIAAKTRWNNDTRELEIDVELYFTEDIPDGAKFNIAFLESHVWGPQTGASDPKNYEHNHILRDLITGQWGENISQTQKGSTFSKTFTYQVSEKFNILNCDIALFVTKSNNEEIFTGIEQKVIPPKISTENFDGRIINTTSKSSEEINIDLTNISDNDVFLDITFEKSERTPEDWRITFINPADSHFLLPAGMKFHITLLILTSESKGIGDFIIKFADGDSISTPVYDTITVLTTDIQFLEIEGGGSDLAVLQNARKDFVSFPAQTYNDVSANLNDLKIVVWNCGKTGRLSSSEANILVDLFSKGTGLLINGSGALPTLTMENSSHALFTTLGIAWTEFNQLTEQTFTLKGIENDPVTRDFEASGLSVANNGYLMQSTDIRDGNIAFPMIKMLENNKTISTRTETETAKAVYLGFNMKIIEDVEIQQTLIAGIIDWIDGVVSVDEKEIKNNPNYIEISYSTNGEIGFKIKNIKNDNQGIDFYIIDLLGRKIRSFYIGKMNSSDYSFMINDIHPGFYIAVLQTVHGIVSKPFIK
ncbi:MAG: Omp28-related outer membrane protein [bacterium]